MWLSLQICCTVWMNFDVNVSTVQMNKCFHFNRYSQLHTHKHATAAEMHTYTNRILIASTPVFFWQQTKINWKITFDNLTSLKRTRICQILSFTFKMWMLICLDCGESISKWFSLTSERALVHLYSAAVAGPSQTKQATCGILSQCICNHSSRQQRDG